MPAKASGNIVGYRYSIGMHFVLAREIDALLGILVGGRIAWGYSTTENSTPVDQLPANFYSAFYAKKSTTGYAGFSTVGRQTSGDFDIDALELFGGDMREGGIKGTVGLLLGEPTQPPDSYLAKFFGDFNTAYRGVVSIILKRVYIGVNPYLKDWAFLTRRIPGSDWRTYWSRIRSHDNHLDANPAHIIRWLLVDPHNMGLSTALVDDTSFLNAATTLHREGFGLSFFWDRQSSSEEFVQQILNHINGVLVTARDTGKFTLTLLRPDYVVSSLLVLNESNIIRLESYQRTSWNDTVNEVTVQYTDRFTGKSLPVTVQDIANMKLQGVVNSVTTPYQGICNPDLALRVAQRDLQTLSTPLSRVKIIATRVAGTLKVGSVFRLSWPKLGIADVVYRVGSINYGNLENREIRIEAAEDVFALPVASYSSAKAPVLLATDPVNPVPALHQRLLEAGFYELMQYWGVTKALHQDSTSAYVMAAVSRPGKLARAYLLRTSAVSTSGPFEKDAPGYFSPMCPVPALSYEISSTFTYDTDIATDMTLAAVGDYGYIDEEAVLITALNTTLGTITVARGILDTPPTPHNAGVLFVVSNFKGISYWEYGAGETLYGYALPQFPIGTLDQADAVPLSVALDGRVARPYAPGNLQLNAQRYPASLSKAVDLNITWAHRSRPQQTAYLVQQHEVSIGPEYGTTYTVTITNSVAGVISTTEDIKDNFLLLAASTFSGLTVGSTNAVEIASVVEGVTSWKNATAVYTVTA